MKLLVGLLAKQGGESLGALLVHLGHEVRSYTKLVSFLSEVSLNKFKIIFIEESFFENEDDFLQFKIFWESFIQKNETRLFFLSNKVKAFNIQYSGVTPADDYNLIKNILRETSKINKDGEAPSASSNILSEDVIEIEEEVLDEKARSLELALVKIKKAESIDEVGVFMMAALGTILDKRKGVFFKYLPTYCSLVSLAGCGVLNRKINGVGLNFSNSKEFQPYEHLSRLKGVPAFMNIIKKVFGHELVELKTIEVEGEVKGVLAFERPPRGKIDLELNVICDFAQSRLTTLNYKKLYFKNKIRDEQTQCLLKDSFFDLLQNEIIRAKRVLLPVTVLVIELDSFFAIKAKYNKERVNILLKSFSKLLSNNIRHNDIIGRIAEERFSIIFPHMSVENALVKAKKIRKLIQQTKFFNDLNQKLVCSTSVSFGTYPTNSPSSDELLSSLSALLDNKESVGCILPLKTPLGFVKDFEERELPKQMEKRR